MSGHNAAHVHFTCSPTFSPITDSRIDDAALQTMPDINDM